MLYEIGSLFMGVGVILLGLGAYIVHNHYSRRISRLEARIKKLEKIVNPSPQ